MVAICYLGLFLVLGMSIATRGLPASSRFIRLWAGCVLGLVGAMWAPVPFAFFLGFTPIAQGAGLVAMVGMAWAIERLTPEPEPTKWGVKGDWPLLLTAAGFMGLLDVLLYTHVLLPGPGGLYVGQSTFGDLAMHLGIVTSMAHQGQFPPEYSLFPGHRLNYPFLVDSLSATLMQLGLPLREAVLLPSYVFSFCITFGFALLARELLRCTKAATLAVMLFFLNGGFGFLYFLDGAKADPGKFGRLFTKFYETPTNLTGQGIYWVNVVVDMLVPQRTTLAGWTVLIFLLWLLQRAWGERRRSLFVLAGVVAGLLPMVHTHSFLGLGVMTVTWAVAFFFVVAPEHRRDHVINWAIFGGLAIALSTPQLFFWTFQQAAEGGFVKLQHDWVNRQDPWAWFWLKNVGLPLILLVPALFASRRRLVVLYTGAVAVFLLADFVVFQRNEYDNNKLFYLWFMLTAVLVGGYLARTFLHGRLRLERLAVLGMVGVFCTASALLTLAREMQSSYVLFSVPQVKAAAFIQRHTAPNALFYSSDNHNNAIAALAGRNIYRGSASFLFFHGVEMGAREQAVKQMATSVAEFKRLAAQLGIDYAYVSSYEKHQLKLEPAFFRGHYPEVYRDGEVSIFAISQAARARAAAMSPPGRPALTAAD